MQGLGRRDSRHIHPTDRESLGVTPGEIGRASGRTSRPGEVHQHSQAWRHSLAWGRLTKWM